MSERLICVFPGQGSQFVGMGKDLCDANADIRALYDAANEAAWSRLYGGIHFRSGIINGLQQGTSVADVILNTIHFE